MHSRTLMSRSTIASAILIVSLAACPAFASTTVPATVPGSSDPYLAGMPNGTACCLGDAAPAQSPVLVSGLTLIPGTPLTFSVTGSVDNSGGAPTFPPDGGFFISAGPFNGIAKETAPINSLLGVFLDNSQPDSSAAPAALDFSSLGTNFASLSPGLKQVFFIGDGLTGNGTGAVQQFIVPLGATRFYLGTADGGGWYDNSGSFSVNVTSMTSAQPFTPTLSTVASPGGTVGVPISDTATLSGGGIASAAPTGTIIFTLFSNALCSPANLVFTSSPVTVTGNGSFTSPPFTPSVSGIFHWIATYSGDANNAPTATLCGSATESVIVAKATPTLSTVASSPGVTLGAAIFDKATLSGGNAPTGQIAFTVYGPNDTNCTTPTNTSVVTVNGNGPYTSASFTPSLIGTYYWVATYSGDLNNASVITACANVSESVIVSAAVTAAAGIPTLSGWGLMTLMVLVVLASIYRLRRL
jgi:IPTL-CTERM motif